MFSFRAFDILHSRFPRGLSLVIVVLLIMECHGCVCLQLLIVLMVVVSLLIGCSSMFCRVVPLRYFIFSVLFPTGLPLFGFRFMRCYRVNKYLVDQQLGDGAVMRCDRSSWLAKMSLLLSQLQMCLSTQIFHDVFLLVLVFVTVFRRSRCLCSLVAKHGRSCFPKLVCSGRWCVIDFCLVQIYESWHVQTDQWRRSVLPCDFE